MNKLQRIEEMERQLAALKAEVEQEEQKQWEPESGGWFIGADGEIRKSPSSSQYKAFGTERKTREQAEKAAKAMRTHNRLLAYVAEFAPDYDPDKSKDRCLVRETGYLMHGYLMYCYLIAPETTVIGAVYMPRLVAEELCRKLNSGEVVL